MTDTERIDWIQSLDGLAVYIEHFQHWDRLEVIPKPRGGVFGKRFIGKTVRNAIDAAMEEAP